MTTPFPLNKKTATTTAAIIMPILAELVSRGDGTYLLKPQVVPSGLDTWISPSRASQIIGIEGRSIYKLVDPAEPFLVCKRPLKGKCLISLRSVMTFVQATSDPDFWNDSLQQEALKKTVREAVNQLRGGGVLQRPSIGTH